MDWLHDISAQCILQEWLFQICYIRFLGTEELTYCLLLCVYSVISLLCFTYLSKGELSSNKIIYWIHWGILSNSRVIKTFVDHTHRSWCQFKSCILKDVLELGSAAYSSHLSYWYDLRKIWKSEFPHCSSNINGNVFYIYCSVHRNILWNNQQMRQCAVKFISLQVHSTCFGRYTCPSSGIQS